MQLTQGQKRLSLGLVTALVCLCVFVIVSLVGTVTLQDRVSALVHQQNNQHLILTHIRHALYEMQLNLQRTFSADARTRNQGSDFNQSTNVIARSLAALVAQSDRTDQQVALDHINTSYNQFLLHKDRVVNLRDNGQEEQASTVLNGQLAQVIDELTEGLDRLGRLYDATNEEQLRLAAQGYKETKDLMILLGILIVGISAVLAIFVIYKTAQSDTLLLQEKERAQVTLYSIGDGVIGTDAQGYIEYLNAMAESLIGEKQKTILGKRITDVLRMETQEGDSAIYDPAMQAMESQAVIRSEQPMLLYKSDKQPMALEYTVAPIGDQWHNCIGAVMAFRDVTDKWKLSHQLVYQASHDALTGLINRSEFEARLKDAVLSSREKNEHHVLCYMDMDQFAVVNDTCGHSAGDELLKQIAALLHKKVRKFDTLARLGGDEFAMLFLNCPLTKATEIVEVLRKAIHDYRYVCENHSFELTASIGMVEITQDSGGLTELLSAADTACFVAKDLGRNRYHLYQLNDAELTKRRSVMQWMSRLREALDEDRFQLFAQKIIPLNSSSEPAHLEVLLRLRDEGGRIIPPLAFMPAAEHYDLMPQIDRWVIDNAFKAMQSEINQTVFWSINLSGQSISDDGLVGYILERQLQYQIAPSRICFEITETAAMAKLSAATKVMNRLRENGYRFALDDFGSGLSSFTYLRHLPVDFLKIDGSFVKDIVQDEISREMVKSINDIGHKMHLKTIAEFVEDEQIKQMLEAIGVDYAQGYHIHRPEPLST